MTEAELDDLVMCRNILEAMLPHVQRRLTVADGYHLETAIRVLERLVDKVG